MDMKRWALDNTIHKVYAGSRLYGTERPDSDWDERGVCLMPPVSLLGMTAFEQYNHLDDDEDVVIYGLTKFFKLALQCNPNILEVLFAPPETWLVQSREWQEVYEHRHLFLSQRVRYTFSGYARSQLKRLQGHYQWLKNPPNHQPIPEEFGGWVEQDKKGGQALTFPHIDAERRYQSAAKNWRAYQTWLRERNPARAKLEAAYGYDTKHAANLVRMTIKGRQLLATCDFNPVLGTTQKYVVMDVMNGKWEYEKLLDWADALDKEIQEMPSDLSKKPSYHAAEVMLMNLNVGSLRNLVGSNFAS